MAVRFDFAGPFKSRTWISQMVRILRIGDKKNKTKIGKEARDYATAWEEKGWPQDQVFWQVLRKYFPEDYPQAIADAKAHVKPTPVDSVDPREVEVGEDQTIKPVSAKSSEEDAPDPKHWKGKKRRNPVDGIEWIFDNIGNEEVDWRTAPSMGDYTYLKSLQKNPALCQKFYEQVWIKTLPSTRDIDEARVIQRDDGADISEFYGELLRKTRKVPDEVLRLGVMGVILQKEQGVNGDA